MLFFNQVSYQDFTIQVFPLVEKQDSVSIGNWFILRRYFPVRDVQFHPFQQKQTFAFVSAEDD